MPTGFSSTAYTNDLEKVKAEIARATGVIAMLYAMVKDTVLAGYQADNKDGCKLDDVISDTINGLGDALAELQLMDGERRESE